jgi:benzoate-CoA ligase
VSRSTGAPDPDDLIAFCRERLAAYKAPAEVRTVQELPLTPTGKVQKYRLLEQWQGAPPASTA